MNPVRASETEMETVHRCLDGDMAGYRRLYETHKDVLYNVAFRMLQNGQDAEDALQEAFVRIFRSLPGFRGECRLSTWIYRILMNTCLTKLRRKRPPVESLDEVENGNAGYPRISGSDGDAAARMILEQEIANLPPGFRSVFVLHSVEGFSHGEIAQMLGITEGTSKSQLSKARRVLQKRLKPFMKILEANR